MRRTQMKIKIAENIKSLRKQHSFTQEQLSEALGVTVSAVYKWESGQSVPEVKMLMELADLFEISVDVLLGYDRQNENIEKRIKRIEQYVKERDFEEAAIEVEKTMKKYPNNFDVVYTAANVYMLMYYEKKSDVIMKKAVQLLYDAIPLLYQNKNSSVNETTIMNLIGGIYIAANQRQKGIEILNQNNICGINNDIIGLTYAMMQKTVDAKKYLYQSYADIINSTMYTMLGMMLIYAEEKNELFLDAGTWLEQFIDSIIVNGERVTFAYKLKAILYAQLAVIMASMGNYGKAEEYIIVAYEHAVKFDAEPNYALDDLKFFKGEELPGLLLDGLGESAIDAIESFVFGNTKDKKALVFVKGRFEVMKNV